DIYADRQCKMEAFFAGTFNLKSPWNPVSRPQDAAPICLAKRADGWQIYFYKGEFHGLQMPVAELKDENPSEILQTRPAPTMIRKDFIGDVLHEIQRLANPSIHLQSEDLLTTRIFFELQHPSFGVLIDSYRGFNEVRYKGRVYGFRQSAGV